MRLNLCLRHTLRLIRLARGVHRALCALCLTSRCAGDGDELEFLPFWQGKPAMKPSNLYSMNPIFTSPFGHGVGDKWFFSPFEGKHGLGMRGNGTFGPADLTVSHQYGLELRSSVARSSCYVRWATPLSQIADKSSCCLLRAGRAGG